MREQYPRIHLSHRRFGAGCAGNVRDVSTAGLRQARLDAEVVIPVKWCGGPGEVYRIDEMGRYLAALRHAVRHVTVVDGSPAGERRRHEEAWGAYARILAPEAWPAAAARATNGKVVGAVTGIRAARHELVVLADDDVRHTPDSLATMIRALADADLVRPVNVYDAWPWQARWDGARSLVNVAIATDWPGTFAVRRSTVLACGGWSAEVLFENLELWRTVQALGGRAVALDGVTVSRRAPTPSMFWSQRVRQAYDDLAQPQRLVVELAILPALGAVARARPRALALVLGAAVAVAHRGRCRVGTDRVPPSVPLWAPVWVLERGVCVWIALGSRLKGGMRYGGRRFRVAAHSAGWLTRRLDPDGQRRRTGPYGRARQDGHARTTHIPAPGESDPCPNPCMDLRPVGTEGPRPHRTHGRLEQVARPVLRPRKERR
ncbi:hypothetical protein GCM10023258_19260 [Terrabacter aeriphilus]|uniref:Glycosyl transferase family 2 n=1 Tax=Terrabacter aeriphilus TaxID=515662 RepID=A0ABP9JAM1_9MICO